MGNKPVAEPIIPIQSIPSRKTIISISIALIIILGFALYANSLNGKFVYDDTNLVENNMFIRDLSAIPKLFIEDIGKSAGTRYAFYRPLQIITYAINYRIWKLNVVGYHLTNIILHILVALCIYSIINILFHDKIVSLLTAALFITHPIHTSVVSYISSCADQLYLLFMLISFIFYIKSLKTKGVLFCVIMLSSYLLALLSKENALILPALILLYHYTFREKIRPREFIPVSGIAFIYLLMRITLLKYLISGAIVTGTLIQRIPGFFAALATYVRLLVLPFGLHMEYGSPLFSFADPKVISGLIILAALIFCIFSTLKTNKLIFFSLSWFLITLLSVSNLFPLNAYMAENWLYLPSIGLFLTAAASLGALYKKSRTPALIIAACLLVFYSYLTIKQNETWADPALFYERTLKYASNSSKAYNNLGSAYYSAGRQEEAVAMYKKALEVNPNYADAYNNLGLAYYNMEKKEEAVTMYKKAIELKPDYVDAYNNLGLAYYKMGKKEEAVAIYKKAMEINPDYAITYNNLGLVYDSMGKKEEAIAVYKKAIEINPDNAATYNNLGNAYYKMGKKEEAIATYKKAIEINPNYAEAYNNLGSAYYSAGRQEEAIPMYKKAMELNSNDATAYSNLGVVYYNTGKREESIAMYKKAMELNPRNAETCYNLGLAYYSMGRKEEAILMYKKAVEINHNYTEAYNNLGVACAEAGRQEEAVAAFKRALEINPNQADARRNLEAISKPR